MRKEYVALIAIVLYLIGFGLAAYMAAYGASKAITLVSATCIALGVSISSALTKTPQ